MISSKPYPIRLNLRQIKNILTLDEYMDAHCFNMAVRILACHDINLFHDIQIHYMDLNFCVSQCCYLSYFIITYHIFSHIIIFRPCLTVHEGLILVG